MLYCTVLHSTVLYCTWTTLVSLTVTELGARRRKMQEVMTTLLLRSTTTPRAGTWAKVEESSRKNFTLSTPIWRLG